MVSSETSPSDLHDLTAVRQHPIVPAHHLKLNVGTINSTRKVR